MHQIEVQAGQQRFVVQDHEDSQYITVQVRDDAGRPLSDVVIISRYDESDDLVLVPFVISIGMDKFNALLNLILSAVNYARKNKAFDVRSFVEDQYRLYNPPVVQPPQPTPITPTPVFAGELTESIAQVEIEAVARKYGLSNPSGIAKMPTISGAFSRNYYIGGKLCIVVCAGPTRATFLVKNDFFLNYTGDNYNNRGRLGAPIEDERGVAEGAEQKFMRGRMLWRRSTGKVEIYDLQGKRIN